MNRTSFQLLFCGGALALASFLHFSGLLLHLPFAIVFVIWICLAFYSYYILSRKIQFEEEHSGRYGLRLALLTCIGLYVGYQSAQLGEKWGEWDAWGIWNQHAKFMTAPLSWRGMFTPALAASHPDYPLMVPGIIAFCSRYGGELIIPYAISIFFSVATVVLVFNETARRNLLAGLLIVPAFVYGTYYIIRGTAQYADTPLAFFYLCAVIMMNYYDHQKKSIYLGMAGFFVLCAAWTKNEGIIMALLFALFYLKDIVKRQHYKAVLLAVAGPAILLLIFKIRLAPSNDLAAQHGSSMTAGITDISRWKIILSSFLHNINLHFPALYFILPLFLVALFVLRSLPGKTFWLVIITMILCQAVYLYTPYSLEWHLATSQDRVMLQVFPALIYLAGIRIAEAFNKINISRASGKAIS